MTFKGDFLKIGLKKTFRGCSSQPTPKKFMKNGLLRVALSHTSPQVQIPITFGGYFKKTSHKIPIIIPFGGGFQTTNLKSQIIMNFGGNFKRTTCNSSFIITFGGGFTNCLKTNL